MATKRSEAKVLEAMHELTQAGRDLEAKWQDTARTILKEVRGCLQVLRSITRREVDHDTR